MASFCEIKLLVILSIVSGPGMTPSLDSHCVGIYSILLTLSQRRDCIKDASINHSLTRTKHNYGRLESTEGLP